MGSQSARSCKVAKTGSEKPKRAGKRRSMLEARKVGVLVVCGGKGCEKRRSDTFVEEIELEDIPIRPIITHAQQAVSLQP